jgi:hypothetical protein
MPPLATSPQPASRSANADDHGVRHADLHTVVSSSALRPGTLTLSLSPGLQAYDITFG